MLSRDCCNLKYSCKITFSNESNASTLEFQSASHRCNVHSMFLNIPLRNLFGIGTSTPQWTAQNLAIKRKPELEHACRSPVEFPRTTVRLRQQTFRQHCLIQNVIGKNESDKDLPCADPHHNHINEFRQIFVFPSNWPQSSFIFLMTFCVVSSRS